MSMLVSISTQVSILVLALLSKLCYHEAMIVSLDTNNPRSLRGVALAAKAASWLHIRLADGRTGYGMPSSDDPLHYWLVTPDSCTCPDAKYGNGRACKHSFAVRLFEVLSAVSN